MLDPGAEGLLLRTKTPFPCVMDPLGIDERRKMWKQAETELSAEMIQSNLSG